MREADLEGRAVALAEAQGFFTRKVSWVGRRAAPDRVFARKDRREVWVEFKAPGETPGLLQLREHERMRAAGMTVLVIDNLKDFEDGVLR